MTTPGTPPERGPKQARCEGEVSASGPASFFLELRNMKARIFWTLFPPVIPPWWNLEKVVERSFNRLPRVPFFVAWALWLWRKGLIWRCERELLRMRRERGRP